MSGKDSVKNGRYKRGLLLLLVLAMTFFFCEGGCGGGGGGGGSSNDQPPIADAGSDQTVTEMDTIALDGSGSSDPDGDISSYDWEQTGGSNTVSLSDSNSEKLTFTAPEVGASGDTLTFKLTVSDSDGATSTDTCRVIVQDIGSTWTEPITRMEFVHVEGGCYQMGCNSTWSGDCGFDSQEKPVHEVCVDEFWISRHEVTQGQWKEIMANNPSKFDKGDNYPVEQVSWNDCQDFIDELNKWSSKTFRLPTEAEWEYAARSGGKKQKYAGGDDVDSVAWYDDNSGDQTHEVGTKDPNGLGIYDMSGNVWEWCSDWHSDDYYSISPKDNPLGPPLGPSSTYGSSRVIRGGHWQTTAVGTVDRRGYVQSDSDEHLGLRLVRTDSEDQENPTPYPVGYEFQVNSYTDNSQQKPSVTSLSGGGFVVTWESEGQDGSSDGIFGQSFDADGNQVGNEFQINSYTDGSQQKPSVTSLSDGGFVVTWESEEQDGSKEGIFGQRFDADGNQVGNEFQVNSYTDDNQMWPSVTSLSDGGFVVTWICDGQTGRYGQRFNASGEPVGYEFEVPMSDKEFNTYPNAYQSLPDITSLSNGGFVELTHRTVDSNQDVFGRCYDTNGNQVDYNFQVNSYTDDQQHRPLVTSLSDGDIVVIWESDGQDGSNVGVFGQRLDTGGYPVGNEFQVNSYTDNSQTFPSVTPLSNGGFVVVWSSLGQDGSEYGVFGQRFGVE